MSTQGRQESGLRIGPEHLIRTLNDINCNALLKCTNAPDNGH
ncbi:hypothetical protein M3J09_005042 [Ascochyta lentis]